MEKLPLYDSATVKVWSPAESTVQISTDRIKQAASSLHWHITVDYLAGEAKYPIGWPRVGRALPAGPLRDWSGWDYLHVWVYTATNRDNLPLIPAGLGLHTPDRTGAYQRTLSELKKDEWVEIRLPLTQIPRHHDVRHIQFHVAESNYRHGDRLDFYFSDLALLRYAVPTLLEVAPESSVLFTDTARIPVRLHLAGVPSNSRADVICELRRGGQVVFLMPVSATRGVQQVVITPKPQSLVAGDYEVHAHLAGQTQTTVARVRLVDSPWK